MQEFFGRLCEQTRADDDGGEYRCRNCKAIHERRVPKPRPQPKLRRRRPDRWGPEPGVPELIF
jgi:hypothetical protein